jgi:ABC-type lipoprotein release transport system permease subunit
MAMVVRTSVDPAGLAAPLRAAIREVDADQPLYDVRPMTEVVERTLHGRLAAGLVLSAGLTRAMSALLCGVSSLDAATYAAVASLLGVVVATASLVPAWRAARVDPALELRRE